jgi:hypothetical protein
MSPRDRPQVRRLRVLPQPRGGWIVVSDQETVGAEYVTASEAERAALAGLREGDELVVYDRYHRCHRRGRSATPQRYSR